jgi:hypothetical protein
LDNQLISQRDSSSSSTDKDNHSASSSTGKKAHRFTGSCTRPKIRSALFPRATPKVAPKKTAAKISLPSAPKKAQAITIGGGAKKKGGKGLGLLPRKSTTTVAIGRIGQKVKVETKVKAKVEKQVLVTDQDDDEGVGGEEGDEDEGGGNHEEAGEDE